MKTKQLFLLLLIIIVPFSVSATNFRFASADTNKSNTSKPALEITVTKRQLNIFSVYRPFSDITRGIGIKYYTLFPFKFNPNVHIGFSVSSEWLVYASDLQLPQHTTKATISYSAPGVAVQCKLNNYISWQVGLSFLLGSEALTTSYLQNVNPRPGGQPSYITAYNTSNNTIFGQQFEQSIWFIKNQKSGLTLGAGIYERVVSSIVYDTEVGAKLHLGFYF